MMKAIAITAVVLAIAIAVVLILAATKPDTFAVQRAAIVNAPAEKIFPLISDFRQWGAWSPYEHKDPAMKRTFSGAVRGTGAVYAWDGDKNVGSGRMEILDVAAPSKIVIKLDFYTPFEAHNTAEFTMLPQDDATRVISGVVHGEDHARVHQHRQNGRQGFRGGSRQFETAGRKVTDHACPGRGAAPLRGERRWDRKSNNHPRSK